jgi:adiponectin receptor
MLSSCAHTDPAVNIYSHLIGAVLFAALPLYLLRTEIPPRYLVATTEDIIVFAIYFAGVAICFCLSAMFDHLPKSRPLKLNSEYRYHTVMNHSREIDTLGAQLDFQGVILLMWGATIPLVFYGFPCDDELRWDYWKLVRSFIDSML